MKMEILSIAPVKIVALSILLVSGTFAKSLNQSNLGQPRLVPNEVLVKFKKTATLSKKINQITAHQHTLLKNVNGWAHVRLESKDSVSEAVSKYANSPEVELVQPNYIYRTSQIPNDPLYSQQWALANTGQTIIQDLNYPDSPVLGGNPGVPGRDISAEAAWNINHDCRNVIVAVIDTGINYNHQDLAGNLWTGGGAYPKGGRNFIEDNNDPMDENGHGTHVAGAIAAIGNNGVGASGVCWTSQLMALRALDAVGSGTTADILEAVSFAITNGAKVINMSFGGPGIDAALETAIVNANAAGIIVVAAAGNEASNNDTAPSYPCSSMSPNVICVAALDQTNSLATFSNYGSVSVDLAAPGVNILSPWNGQVTTISDPLTEPASWTLDAGFWAFTTFAGFDVLANPVNWNATNLYTDNQHSKAYKTYDTFGTFDVLTASLFMNVNIEDADDQGFVYDYLSFYCKNAAGDPTTADENEINFYFGHYGASFQIFNENISKCVGDNTSIGFLFHSDGDINDTGVAILPITYYGTTLNDNTYNVIRGTSMASPYVAGIAALVASFNPSYSYLDVINAVKAGGTQVLELASKTVTGKAANAFGSLSYIAPPTGVAVVKN